MCLTIVVLVVPLDKYFVVNSRSVYRSKSVVDETESQIAKNQQIVKPIVFPALRCRESTVLRELHFDHHCFGISFTPLQRSFTDSEMLLSDDENKAGRFPTQNRNQKKQGTQNLLVR